MFAILERRQCIRKGISVLHFAPDQGLAVRIRMLASNYITADFYPEQYVNIFPETRRVDLCKDGLSEYRSSFDLVLHNHVLEHLPCALSGVLSRMVSCLKPRGEMYFSTPIRKNSMTDEKFDLSPEENRVRFGQIDHVRMLGDIDALNYLKGSGVKLTVIDPLEFLSVEEMKMYKIPLEQGLTGGTIFCCTRL